MPTRSITASLQTAHFAVAVMTCTFTNDWGWQLHVEEHVWEAQAEKGQNMPTMSADSGSLLVEPRMWHCIRSS